MSLADARGLPVETERLLIRPMQSEDAAFIMELLNEPDFLENIGDKGVRSIRDALGYIQSAGWDNYRKHGFGMNTVELVDASSRIGICGLLQRDTLDHPDVGFAYLAAFHGNGLGPSLDLLFGHPPVLRVGEGDAEVLIRGNGHGQSCRRNPRSPPSVLSG